MKKYGFFVAVGILMIAGLVVAGGLRFLRASLKGNNEIPIVYTDATGAFRASFNNDETQIEYDLTYADLEAPVTQAHIHIGKKSEAGGISVWLCANNPPITTAPAGTQICPTPGGTIHGVITAANVVGPVAQGVPAGDFARLIRAIKEGNTYANVHTTRSPSGEIRGQIDRGKGHDDHDNDDADSEK